ncbi:efflux RND transporter periplasmic adaptor subunit [Aestuariibaculum suncheonense]|uniref:Efflux RND transporter periplasmic adaptor subunit n=1 Tax=Aestuariibaculum suncheonense TaxID=1028745 RepID=A0A8J6Q7K7_9FLAO|nr:efflux RND transporter periplasmic adaptor subunit [Aestuariibaculum suncheonense]MBD0836048.1 efflux RND transporter periplasmic adaptor subunit [Aestuariibaculum suncheonense]
MKKYIIYVVILGVGLLLGWVLFGGSSSQELEHNHESEASVSTMWTCSMHPQIMQPEPGDCPICGMDLIPAEAGAEGLTADQFKLTENAVALANIQTTILGSAAAESNGILLSGKIAENESANAVQVSYVAGRLEHLNVSFTGEDVRKGQLLATVYSPELYAAQQELLTAASLKESQPELYQAVRSKLKLWKLSDSQINQIESTGKVKENLPVYATVSGVVTQKMVNQGDYIKQGQPLLKIADLGTVWANFDVYENQISQFKKGQDIEVTAKAYPGKVFSGKVDFIDPVLNTNTRTVSLRVVLKNGNREFKPGMFIQAEVKGGKEQHREVLTVPTTAVMWTGERSVVYLKASKTSSVFEMREVTLGNRLGETYEVLDGLNSGDEIVTNGTFTVDAAAQLQGKKSMMNQPKEMIAESDQQETNRLTVSKDFQEQLKFVYNQYIVLKDALVVGNSEKASEASQSIGKSLMKVDMKLLKENEAHMRWMTQLKTIESHTASILKSSKIDEQRQYFKGLSDALIAAIQSFGINEKVFLEFCPMANDNNGAYWLSKEEKILNPYFGDAMLSCGEVKQIIE